MDKDLLICECRSSEHVMTVFYSDDTIDGRTYPTVYINTHLTKRPFWQRVAYGLRYIFGRQCRYGAFDEFIINPDDAVKFEKIVEFLRK